MKLTIVAEDRVISIDGVSFSDLDISALNPSIHAVQWYGEYGEVEYKSKVENNQIVKPQNQLIQDFSEFQWAVDAWNVAKQEYDKMLVEQIPAVEAGGDAPTNDSEVV